VVINKLCTDNSVLSLFILYLKEMVRQVGAGFARYKTEPDNAQPSLVAGVLGLTGRDLPLQK
jgi:hypothetical protein